MICLLTHCTDKLRQYRLKPITRDETSKQEIGYSLSVHNLIGNFLRLKIVLVIVSNEKKIKIGGKINEKRTRAIGMLVSLLFIRLVVLTLNLLFILFVFLFLILSNRKEMI